MPRIRSDTAAIKLQPSLGHLQMWREWQEMAILCPTAILRGKKSLHSLPTLAKISANAATPLLLSTKSYCVMIRLHKPSPPRVTAVSQCAGRSFMVMGRSFLMVINLQISISPFFSPNYCPIYEMFYAITCGFLWYHGPFCFGHGGIGLAIKSLELLIRRRYKSIELRVREY